MSFPLPSGFPLFAYNWIHSLVKDSFKTVSKIHNKLDFLLTRFYGNWIFFSKFFCLFFLLRLKWATNFAYFATENSHQGLMCYTPFSMAYFRVLGFVDHRQLDLWKPNLHFANWSEIRMNTFTSNCEISNLRTRGVISSLLVISWNLAEYLWTKNVCDDFIKKFHKKNWQNFPFGEKDPLC